MSGANYLSYRKACATVLFTPTSGVVTPDWQTLITALGGNSSVLAFYDGRFNVTSSAGVASAWTDVRGGGFGPAFAATGTGQPAYNGTSTLTFDGVANAMWTAASALFDVSGPLSFVMVGSSTATTNWAGIADSSTAVRLLSHFPTSSNYSARGGSPNTTAGSSTVATGSTTRLLIASSGANAVNIDAPTKTRVSAAITMCATGHNTLSLGSYFQNTSVKPCIVKAVLIIPRVVTAGDITALKTYATGIGATLA